MKATNKTIQDINVHYHKTTQFKTVFFSVKFIGRFLPETVNARALLPDLLLSGTRRFPSKLQIQKELNRLYGTDIQVHTSKMGLNSVISFDMTLVNGEFLPGKPQLLEEAVQLLSEVIYHPKRIRNRFRKNRFDEEKRQLREELEADYHDKVSYAFSRFRKQMFQDELYRYSANGDLESLEEVTLERIEDCYQTMCFSDQVQIYVAGDFDEKLCDHWIARYFFGSKKAKISDWLDRETRPVTAMRDIEEFGDLNQSRIIVGFRSGIESADSLYYPMSLFNTLLGESDQAKLFLKIREENQLSYDISSVYVPNKGVLMVMAGVDNNKEEETIAKILEVIESFGPDLVSEEDLQLAKEMMRKRIIQTYDSLHQIVQKIFFDERIYGHHQPLKTVLSLIDQVSIQEILQAKESLILDTIYRLRKAGEAT